MHIPALTAVNTIAPYILTCLMHRPRRLVYVTSGYHHNGDASLRDVAWQERGGGSRSGGGEDDDAAWSDLQAYADSKLHDVLLAKAFARRWGRGESSSSSVGEGRGVRSNALDPGWVPTKMGGASAPGSLDAAVETYVMLAEGADGGGGGGGGGDRAGKGSDGSGEGGDATGKLFGPRRKEIRSKAEADDVGVQDRLIEILEEITGVKFPE